MSQQPYPLVFTRALAQTIISQKPIFKTRFLVRRGEQFLSIPAEEILCFTSEHKVTFCITKDQLKFSVENTLEELDKLLDPAQFFRVNRQCIVHFNAIDKIHSYFNGKLLVKIKSRFENEFTISKDRSGAFKSWLNQ
jgi:two-component system, LytTR family, response regulator